MPFPRLYKVGPGGTGPLVPGENWVGHDFAFDDVSPLFLFQLPKDYRILTCRVEITTVFNDIAATLEVGDLAQVNRYMDDTENVPSELGDNETKPYRLLSVNSDFYLTINPGASTQGAGVVFIEFDQPFV